MNQAGEPFDNKRAVEVGRDGRGFEFFDTDKHFLAGTLLAHDPRSAGIVGDSINLNSEVSG